jgi:hypothetical protein
MQNAPMALVTNVRGHVEIDIGFFAKQFCYIERRHLDEGGAAALGKRQRH